MKFASNHSDFGYRLVCRFGVVFSLLIGLEVAVTQENKNNHFIGSAMGRAIVAGAYGADAVSVLVASTALGLVFCFVGVFRYRLLPQVGLEVAVPK